MKLKNGYLAGLIALSPLSLATGAKAGETREVSPAAFNSWSMRMESPAGREIFREAGLNLDDSAARDSALDLLTAANIDPNAGTLSEIHDQTDELFGPKIKKIANSVDKGVGQMVRFEADEERIQHFLKKTPGLFSPKMAEKSMAAVTRYLNAKNKIDERSETAWKNAKERAKAFYIQRDAPVFGETGSKPATEAQARLQSPTLQSVLEARGERDRKLTPESLRQIAQMIQSRTIIDREKPWKKVDFSIPGKVLVPFPLQDSWISLEKEGPYQQEVQYSAYLSRVDGRERIVLKRSSRKGDGYRILEPNGSYPDISDSMLRQMAELLRLNREQSAKQPWTELGYSKVPPPAGKAGEPKFLGYGLVAPFAAYKAYLVTSDSNERYVVFMRNTKFGWYYSTVSVDK